jgi:hypothetical protein
LITFFGNRIFAVHLDLNQRSARGGLRWINGFREHIVIMIFQVRPPWRIAMKPVALLITLCALCGPAIAQTTECQSIPKASDRLACYDRLSPPKNMAKPVSASAKPSTPSTEQSQAGDMLANENARLDAKINNICRGC